jgi:hypothetical protein
MLSKKTRQAVCERAVQNKLPQRRRALGSQVDRRSAAQGASHDQHVLELTPHPRGDLRDINGTSAPPDAICTKRVIEEASNLREPVLDRQ